MCSRLEWYDENTYSMLDADDDDVIFVVVIFVVVIFVVVIFVVVIFAVFIWIVVLKVDVDVYAVCFVRNIGAELWLLPVLGFCKLMYRQARGQLRSVIQKFC